MYARELTVLVSHVMYVDVVADVLKVLRYALGYRYFAYGNAEALHERDSIVVSTVGSAESRHRNANNTLTVVVQLVECLDTYQQGKS